MADDAQRERSVEGGDIALHCQVVALSEIEPLVTLFAQRALPANSASIAAEVVISNHRKVTELMRGTYVTTSPDIDALRAKLDADTVDALSAAAAATIGALSVRDAAGAAQSGDWLTAVSAAEIALEYALDTALFAAGDTYRSRKFLPRRLSRYEHLAPLLDDLRRTGSMPADTEADLERRARATLLAANGIQAAALLATGPIWERTTEGQGPRRSPYVTLVATEAGLWLAGATEVSVTRPGAVLWLLADGRPKAELAQRFADLHGLDPDTVTGFVETNVTALADAQTMESG